MIECVQDASGQPLRLPYSGLGSLDVVEQTSELKLSVRVAGLAGEFSDYEPRMSQNIADPSSGA